MKKAIPLPKLGDGLGLASHQGQWMPLDVARVVA